MDEIKTKKREWVKNAAIIFLAVMLVLTFFSNTIMNNSLPEVATASVLSGEIKIQVRGTGTVTANENYEVTLSSSREIESVKVHEGDTVHQGDLLFTLSAAKSNDLIGAEESVDAAREAYQKQLLMSSNGTNDAKVLRAKEALQDAQAELASCTDVSSSEVVSAKKNSDIMKQNAANLEIESNKAANALSNAGGWEPSSGNGDYSAVVSASQELKEAKTDYEAAKIRYGDDYDVFKRAAITQYVNRTGNKYGDDESVLTADMKALYLKYKDDITGNEKLAYAYKEITDANNSLTEKQNAYNKAVNDYNAANYSNTDKNYKLKLEADKAKLAYDTALVEANAAETLYNNLKNQKQEYSDAKQNVYAKEDELAQLLTDIKSSSIDLASSQRALARAQSQYASLAKDSNETEVRAKVDGIVKSINAIAGKTVEPDTSICTIELPEQGYIVSYAVSADQAKKVHPGETGTISNFYNGDVSATLQTIKSDPQNPQSSKILVFNIDGDIEPGTSLTISVGQKNAEYETIVPNSSVRSDSNGDFILVVTSKNSPLGNRYIATRVDVEKVATDETNTAVTGAVNPYDFVITTSSKPIKNNDKVKLADA